MSRDVEQLFHETWLGEAQPLFGLTFTVPVLCDGGAMLRLSSAQAEEFFEYAPATAKGEHRLTSLRELLTGFLGWTESELPSADSLPDDLVLRIAEEGTELRPDFAVGYGRNAPARSEEATVSGEQTPASRAGAAFQLLAWELPAGLSMDSAESETSEWHYPPTAKMERLLRETRVPIGLLSNAETVRLLYCPTEGSTGWISFPVGFMATPPGRDMLSAFRELLHADRVLGSAAETPTTLQLLADSRERQADVTTKLGGQLLDALQILLQGFEAAAHRDGDEILRDALAQEGNHVYEGLLTVMLRLVFGLAAEDRGLVPAEHPVYVGHFSVGGLYDELAADEAIYADTMEQRFGAWARLVMLFRALYFGVELPAQAGEPGVPALTMQPHRGRLFNPANYAFLEGARQTVGTPLTADARAQARIPSISDGVVLRILRRLLYLDGQRLSYGSLNVEVLGGVYEGLMGFAVERRTGPSVCLRPNRVWVSPHELLEQASAVRVRWLKDAGVPDAAAKRIGDAVDAALKESGDDAAALEEAVLVALRRESIVPRRKASRREADTEEAEVATGRLVIQPGEERRRTSTHYTPQSLSAPIVAKTLEPLLAAMRAKAKEEDPAREDPQPSSDALLSLKICDPAMGSGAFLVEACRFLAKQVHAAWVREGKLASMIALADPDDVVHRDPELLAQRMVAQRCLYGVDKNPLAVELGKLSLWLLTLSRGQTFTFLDHCLKAGDSLVGLDRDQILAMDWEVSADGKAETGGKKKRKSKKKGGADDLTLDLFAEQAQRAFAKAMAARRKLADLARSGDRGRTEEEQHALHVEAEAALERLRDVADVVVSAFFWPHDEPGKLTPEFLFEGKKPKDKDRRACLQRLRHELNEWLGNAEQPNLPRGLDVRRALVRECIRPMHWHLEFPEVFDDGREDPLAREVKGKVWMDAVVGNPPFAGKNRTIRTHGPHYLAYLLSEFRPSHGNSDLSAYFLRRCYWLLGEHGSVGLIATNSIGQGDTRESGLRPLIVEGARIYSADCDVRWPTEGADVTASIVHLAAGSLAEGPQKTTLNGELVDQINTRLQPKAEPSASALKSRQGLCFVGSYPSGAGFVLSSGERDALIRQDPQNEKRVARYLSGEEFNNNPTQTSDRFIIDFGELSLDDAERWPQLVSILRERVKPERETNKRKARREKWWRFAERASDMYLAIESLERCLATRLTSKHRAFEFVCPRQVIDQTLVVVASSSMADFGFLQSRIHEVWALENGGAALRVDPRYSGRRCFETFVVPGPPCDEVEIAARTLREARADFMVATQQGLTKTYNALKNPEEMLPDILHLRRLHEDLDRAVLTAYGQSDIEVPPYCGASPEAVQRFEDGVLDFLFSLNEERATEEAREGARARIG